MSGKRARAVRLYKAKNPHWRLFRVFRRFGARLARHKVWTVDAVHFNALRKAGVTGKEYGLPWPVDRVRQT
jgi:hypothetical protein